MLTTEPCPTCGLLATCAHGLYVNGRAAHVWQCRACGEHIGVLCYACADCERFNAQIAADDQRMAGRAL